MLEKMSKSKTVSAQAFFPRRRGSREGESTVVTDLSVVVRSGREKKLASLETSGPAFFPSKGVSR